MSQKHYDVAVIGGRLEAALLAALLARSGLRGVLIDQGELASASQLLLADTLISEDSSPIVKAVHAELGIQGQTRHASEAIHPAQLIFEDDRIDLFPLESGLLAELYRGLGQHAGIEAFLRYAHEVDEDSTAFLDAVEELPAVGFFARRKFGRLKRRHALTFAPIAEAVAFQGLPERFQRLLLKLQPFLTHFSEHSPGAIPAARLVRPFLRLIAGRRCLPQGQALRHLLLQNAKERGFAVIESAVRSLKLGSHGFDLEIEHQDSRIAASLVIDASSDLSGLGVASGGRLSAMAALLQKARPEGYLHRTAFELDTQAVPEAMSRELLLMPTASDPEAMWLSQQPSPKKGRTRLVLSHPVSVAHVRSVGLEPLEDAMRRRLLALIPYFEAGRPVALRTSERGAVQKRVPVLPHPLFPDDLDPESQIAGLPFKTHQKGLFIAGPQVLPGFGIEGAYLTARQLTRHLSGSQPSPSKGSGDLG